MSAKFTPAVERAANELAQGGVGLYVDRARRLVAAALDVGEITEALAREQWNSLPLVHVGEVPDWDEDVVTERERKHFRDRCRPFAEAVIRAVVGA